MEPSGQLALPSEPKGDPNEVILGLRDRLERYRELLMAVPAYSYSVFLEDGRPSLTEHGPGCAVVTGYKPGDYVTDPLLWIAMVHPDDREAVRAHAAAVLTGRPTPPIEHRIYHRDGRLRWVRNTAVPHRDSAGSLDRYDGLVEDITERKRAEETLRETERLKGIGTLAGGVSHRFAMLAETITERAASLAEGLPPDTRAREDAQRILDVARHMAHLTQRLTSVARMCNGSEELPVSAVAVEPVIRDTIEMMQDSLESRRIRMEFRGEARPRVARCSASQLMDVLMNLFLNAAEAMPEGGSIRVDVSERKTRPRKPVFGREGARAEYIVVRVRDTGVGISREILGKVFDPFFTTNRDRPVLGLGLTVVRSIVLGWGGGVSVRSRVGAGASFRLLLPASGPAPEQDRRMDGRGGQAVLLADDDAAVVFALKAEFERVGYRVYAADGAEGAAQLYRDHSGGIVAAVIDAMLPGGGIGALVKEMLDKEPAAMVILTSGFSRDVTRTRVPPGGWNFAQKPLDEARLVRMVMEAAQRVPPEAAAR